MEPLLLYFQDCNVDFSDTFIYLENQIKVFSCLKLKIQKSIQFNMIFLVPGPGIKHISAQHSTTRELNIPAQLMTMY